MTTPLENIAIPVIALMSIPAAVSGTYNSRTEAANLDRRCAESQSCTLTSRNVDPCWCLWQTPADCALRQTPWKALCVSLMDIRMPLPCCGQREESGLRGTVHAADKSREFRDRIRRHFPQKLHPATVPASCNTNIPSFFRDNQEEKRGARSQLLTCRCLNNRRNARAYSRNSLSGHRLSIPLHWMLIA